MIPTMNMMGIADSSLLTMYLPMVGPFLSDSVKFRQILLIQPAVFTARQESSRIPRALRQCQRLWS